MFLTIVRPAQQLLIDRKHRRFTDKIFQFVGINPANGAVFVLADTQWQRIICLKEIRHVQMQMASDCLSALCVRPDRQDFNGCRAASQAYKGTDTAFLLRFAAGNRFEIA